MGNQPSLTNPQAITTFKDYEQVSRVDQGIIYRQKVTHLQTNDTYYQHFILKEHNYPNQELYNKNYQKYCQSIEQNKNHQTNTLQVKEVIKEQIKHFCSNSYKVYTLYEYPQLNLHNEITVRAEMEKYFQEDEVVAILQTCLLALQEIKATICFSSRVVYISPDGVIKVVHNDLVDENYRHLMQNGFYYAPEKFTNFYLENYSENAIKKQIIFSMGMTLLQTCLLEQMYSLYDFNTKTFDGDGLERRLTKLSEKYSNQLVDILANMLEINPNRRISVLEIQRALNRYDQVKGEIVENQEERCEMDKKCDELFAGSNLQEKTSKTTDYAEEPTVPNLLSHQNSSRMSMIQPLPTHFKQSETFTSNGISYKIPQSCNDRTPTHNLTNYSNFIPQNSTANFSNLSSGSQLQRNPIPLISENQHLFTDPKLLEMIRKDLDQISKSRTSRVIMHTNRHSQINMNHISYHDIHNNQTQRFEDLNESVNYNNQQYKMLANCQQVQSLNASIAREHMNSQHKQYVYEQSTVKRHPEELSIQNSRSISVDYPKERLCFETQNNNNRVPLKQVNNNTHHDNFNEIQTQLKKDMMKKKQSNLVYLEQIYEDGVKYQGMSKKGLKQGYGKLIYNDGAYYEGYFHEDRINGKGVLYYNLNQPAYDGEWQDEQFNGYGKLYNQDPQELQEEFPYHNFNFLANFWIRYEGEFLNDNKNGQGKIFLTSQQYIEAQFKDDMVNGEGRFVKRDGRVIEGRWENNILVDISSGVQQQQ